MALNVENKTFVVDINMVQWFNRSSFFSLNSVDSGRFEHLLTLSLENQGEDIQQGFYFLQACAKLKKKPKDVICETVDIELCIRFEQVWIV